MLYGTVAVLAAVLLSAVLSRGVRALCLRTGTLDRPGGRKTHPRPTPHLGGLAVAAATCVVCCTGYAPLGDDVQRLLWAAGAVALLGLVDDLRGLGPLPRLAVETAAACAVVIGSGLSPFAAVLAVGWIVLVTNACNLLDNSDGAAGTVAAVTALGFALCAASVGRPGLALLLTVLAAALAGFLTLNWHPARLFLGDCGALFTGFVLGSAGVLVHTGRDVLPGAGALFALSAVLLADTALVVLSRRRAGRPLLRGGTDHIAHRLRRIGFTVPGAAVVLGAASLVGAVIGVLVHRGALGPAAVLPLLCATAAAVLALLRVRVYGKRGRRRATTSAAAPTSGVRPAGPVRGGGPAGRRGGRSAPGPRPASADRGRVPGSRAAAAVAVGTSGPVVSGGGSSQPLGAVRGGPAPETRPAVHHPPGPAGATCADGVPDARTGEPAGVPEADGPARLGALAAQPRAAAGRPVDAGVSDRAAER